MLSSTSHSGIVDSKQVESSMFVNQVFVFESPEPRGEEAKKWFQSIARMVSHQSKPSTLAN